MTFDEALKQQLLKHKRTRGNAGKLLVLINEKQSTRRTKILDRLERHARVFLKDHGYKNVEEINDWSGLSDKDWDKFFDSLLKFLTAILPILLAFLG